MHFGQQQVGCHTQCLKCLQLLYCMQDGEADKQKSYLAKCRLPCLVTDDMLQRLASMKNVVLQQTTPTRVEQRRAMLVRHYYLSSEQSLHLASCYDVLDITGALTPSFDQDGVSHVKSTMHATLHTALGTACSSAHGACSQSSPGCVCWQVREKTVHEMRGERDADDPNGLLLHLRTQVICQQCKCQVQAKLPLQEWSGYLQLFTTWSSWQPTEPDIAPVHL